MGAGLMYKLGKMVKDKASGMNGCIMLAQIQGTADKHTIWYDFQPAKLNPETGCPVDRTWVNESRIEGGQDIGMPSNVPLDILGTYAKDTVTGFDGIIISLNIHINGCIHASIQPQGSIAKTGGMKSDRDFDIRLLSGPKIPSLNDEQLEVSRKKSPSPEPIRPLMSRRM